jgi:hypothetical protein
LAHLVFHIRVSPSVGVTRSEVRRSRQPRNASSSSYPSLMHLWRHFPLIVIGMTSRQKCTMNISNENLMTFHAVFKLFCVRVCNFWRINYFL